jgi:hypothetical protein
MRAVAERPGWALQKQAYSRLKGRVSRMNSPDSMKRLAFCCTR